VPHASPRHRYHVALKAAEAKRELPRDPKMAALCELLQGKPCELADVEYAYDLFSNVQHRATMDAFILAKTPADKIKECLEIGIPTIVTYHELFMDATVFRNKLELLSYAHDYDGDETTKALVLAGVRHGPAYLMWSLGSQQELDPRAVVRQAMTDTYFRSMAHKGNSLTSLVAKEAHRWAASSIRTAQIVEQIDPRSTKEAFDELRLALLGVDDTKTVADSPVPIDQILR
jgi:hypothetical protein